MSIVLAFTVIIHTFLFILAIGSFWLTAKKESFLKIDWALFVSFTTVSTFISFSLVSFAVNSLEGLQGSQLAMIGYTAFPVVPIALGLITYPLFQLAKTKNPKLKYSSLFWALVLSAPLSYGLSSIGIIAGLL